MNKKDIEAFAKEAAKGIKTPEDLNQFSQMLKKITVEAALNAEMDDHLGYEKHRQSSSANSRNVSNGMDSSSPGKSAPMRQNG
jgi:putative transposase